MVELSSQPKKESLTLARNMTVNQSYLDGDKIGENITDRVRSDRFSLSTILNIDYLNQVREMIGINISGEITQINVFSSSLYGMVSGIWSFGRPFEILTRDDSSVFQIIRLNSRHWPVFEDIQTLTKSKPGILPNIGPILPLPPDAMAVAVEYVADLSEPTRIQRTGDHNSLDLSREEVVKAKTLHLFSMLDENPALAISRPSLWDVAVVGVGDSGQILTRICVNPNNCLTSASITQSIASLLKLDSPTALSREEIIESMVESLVSELQFDKTRTLAMLSVAKRWLTPEIVDKITFPDADNFVLRPDDYRKILSE